MEGVTLSMSCGASERLRDDDAAAAKLSQVFNCGKEQFCPDLYNDYMRNNLCRSEIGHEGVRIGAPYRGCSRLGARSGVLRSGRGVIR
jgi:hypothetical protein